MAPRRRVVVVEEGGEVLAVHLARDGEPEVRQHRGRHVVRGGVEVLVLAGPAAVGVADHVGHLVDLLVAGRGAVAVHAVLAERGGGGAHEVDQRAVLQALAVQLVEQAPDLPVHGGHLARVVVAQLARRTRPGPPPGCGRSAPCRWSRARGPRCARAGPAHPRGRGRPAWARWPPRGRTRPPRGRTADLPLSSRSAAMPSSTTRVIERSSPETPPGTTGATQRCAWVLAGRAAAGLAVHVGEALAVQQRIVGDVHGLARPPR